MKVSMWFLFTLTINHMLQLQAIACRETVSWRFKASITSTSTSSPAKSGVWLVYLQLPQIQLCKICNIFGLAPGHHSEHCSSIAKKHCTTKQFPVQFVWQACICSSRFAHTFQENHNLKREVGFKSMLNTYFAASVHSWESHCQILTTFLK